jgi:hypothetical protein
MKDLLRKELENGSFGLSIGLEYLQYPVRNLRLFLRLRSISKIWVPVHIRKRSCFGKGY